MSTNQQTTLHDLAETVANEIREAFKRYGGQKWEMVKGSERAVTFNIEVPSLKGKNVRDLNPQGLHCTGDFNSRLGSAGGKYVGRSLRGCTLHGIHYALGILNDEYTGLVAISDGSSAWDYDL